MHFSVIVPVYNSARTIGRTLASLEEFYRAGDEVIVVDDHSAQDAGCLTRDYPVTLTVLPHHAGPATARNKGASISTHPWLFFVDSDVVCKPGTRALLVRLAARHDAMQWIYVPLSAVASIATEYQNNYYYYVFSHISGRPTAVCGSFCFAIRRDLFIRAGGFDETIVVPTVEDEKLGYSLFEQGVDIYVCPELQVEHLARYTLVEFVKRRFAMAYGQAQTFLKKKNPGSIKRFISLHASHKSHHLPSFLLGIVLLPFTYLALAAFAGTLSPYALLAWAVCLVFILALNSGLLSSLAALSGRCPLGVFAIFLLDLHVLGAGISYGLLDRLSQGRR